METKHDGAAGRPLPLEREAVVMRSGGGGLRQQRPHITVVIGPPPCTGKTTYVAERAQPGDLVVDYDALLGALAGMDPYDPAARGPALHAFACEARAAIIAKLMERPSGLRRAWVISCYPRGQVEPLLRRPSTQLVTLDTPAEVCVERARAAGRPANWPELIEDWWGLEAA